MIKTVFILFVLFFAESTFAQKYVQVWGDEYNTPGLPDSTKWNFEVGKLRNGELQYFTYKREENARIEDSILIIELRKEQFEGADYTSASIVSKGIGDWKYGKIEINAKVPTGKGTWPALWMMPTYSEYGGWPRSGEIDIMEYIGVEPQNLWYTTHFTGTDGTGHESDGSGAVNAITNPFNQFIKFTLIWTPEKLEWYANDVKYHEYKKSANDSRVWPFDKKFYLIFGLSYGGTWGGYNGVDDSLLPHKFLIDYVRVYQLQETEGPFTISIEPPNGGKVEINPQMDFYPENTEVTITAVPDSTYVFKAWRNQSAANPYTFIVRKNTTILPEFRVEKEILSNSTFDFNYYPWRFYVNNDQNINYSVSTDNKKFVTNITKTTGTNWHLGFQETNLSLQKGKYKLTFDAYADQQKSLMITISKNYPDWSSFVQKSATITTSEKHYEITIDMPVTDKNVRLFFGIGKFSGKFTIDNISLSRIIPTNNKELFEIKDKLDFNIYPNPNEGVFTLKFNSNSIKNRSLKIYNSNGKLIHKQSILNSENQIEIENPKSGIYFLQTIANSGITTKKIIIR